MPPTGVHLWRLSEAGDKSLGVSCTPEGLFLGRTALIERHGRGYEVRASAEIERLLGPAYGYPGIALDRVMPGLGRVASALGEGNLCLAQIAALRLRLPDLPDGISRDALEAEDALIKAAPGGPGLARAGWDPAEHPRAGVPPNPGWFAPTGGSGAGHPPEIAQNEEERAPEELADPAAPMRQELWDARIAILRQLDPGNPNLSYLSDPGSTPSQAALDRLNEALRAAAVERVANFVMPGGKPIGQQGGNVDVRMLEGGFGGARSAFNYLRVGGTLYDGDYPGTMVTLPGGAGFVGLRTNAQNVPTIDINVPAGIGVLRLHYQ